MELQSPKVTHHNYHFLLSAIALLLGFNLLYILRLNAKKRRKSKEIERKLSNDAVNGGLQLTEAGGNIDVIIVGAGVAGAALACTLAKVRCSNSNLSNRLIFASTVLISMIHDSDLSFPSDGRRVHVIERDLTEPDRIVGELLQPGGYLKLIELGLEDCVDGIEAQQVFGYAIYMDGRNTKLSYPLEKFESDISGRSFHNGRFIQRMREKAASLPNVKLEQGTVTSLFEKNGTVQGVYYKTKDGQTMTAHAPLTIVCDGCFSNLRRALCKPKVEVPSCFVGLVLKNVDLPYANHGHVILADPSPILFYPISNTEVRCLVDVPGQKVPSIANGEMANYLKTVVAPQIPNELYDAFVSAVDKGNIRAMPNRSMPADPQPTPGALLMGDAFNMRHPLTGGGMTVALSDIVLLRDLLRPLRNLNDPTTLCNYLECFYTLRKATGVVYDKHVGGCSIQGLNPSPVSTFLRCGYIRCRPSPDPGASGIIFPIIKSEGVRQMFFPATIPAYYKSPQVA
ncbi:hypothetical protein L1987_70878 [Smallanthus sonchifolius]|uniref:Uncharacterized protein n=1 Tax=Smallanthus sonchifolius TaxID=185202 RepID=A0ACB9AQ35_9ASTR|nr:hypothetical protein L1987_70878 [Smallanthus sonchifolius]